MTSDSPTSRNSSAPEFRRKRRIALTLLAVMILVGLGPLAFVSWKLIGINREALTTSQQEIQLLLASSTGQKLNMRLEGLEAEMTRVAQVLGVTVRLRETPSRDQIRQVLNGVIEGVTPYLRYEYFAGGKVESIEAGELPSPMLPYFDAALERTAEARSSATSDPEARRPLVSEPIVLEDLTRRSMLVIAAPVISRGRFRGVLTALVDIDRVWEDMTRNNRVGHVIYAVDENGVAFATSDPVRVRKGRDLSSSPLVQRFAVSRLPQTLPFDLVREGETTSYIGSFVGTPRGWGILVQAPQSQVYWTVRSMVESTLTWALASLLLAFLVSTYFARRISQPIDRLAAASREFARGKFNSRVEVCSKNEIGELADTFNRMAQAIEDYIRRLKRALAENNELFLGTIRALAQAIDAKDPYTRGHSIRVNRYSVILARTLGLSEEQIREIHVSSLLHDVGKIGINDAILQKPGALTDDEFAIMKTHPALGANIMAPIKQMEKILPGLRWHHERLSGGGYPDGLKQDQIPMMARIIAVADTFDAITTTRPYQNPMTFDQAVARLNELKGTALDTKVVEAFNRAVQAGRIVLGQDADEVPAPDAEVAGEMRPEPEPVAPGHSL